MKIGIKQFLGQNHSWACVGQALARELIKRNHIVDLFATDGIKHFPADLKPNLVGYTELDDDKIIGNKLSNDYDMELSYTTVKNFPHYLNHNPKSKKYGLWAYEFIGKNNTNTLPVGFAKNYNCIDKLLLPSNFCKQIFLNGNVPSDKIEILPHGFSDNFIEQSDIYSLKTDRKFKFLFNIGQCHKRKGIEVLLDAWGKAFNNKDDVALICKTVVKKPEAPFELYWPDLIQQFKKKYPKHAPIISISEFIPDLSSL